MNDKGKNVKYHLSKLGITQSKVTNSDSYDKPVIIYSSNTYSEDKNSDLWAKVFDVYYKKIISEENSLIDTSVWKSSYTKKIIPNYEIKDWIDGFIKKIDRFLNEDASILEIGCGNGLILNKVISRVEKYTAVDSSYFAIESIKNSSTYENNKHKITLHQCDASEISNIDSNSFDLIILNSVVQYFSSIEYLLNLLSLLQYKVKSSSVIVIGDVRSYHSSDLHFYEMVKSKKNKKYNGSTLKKKIETLKKREKETLYSPIFFKSLHLIFDWISSVSVTIKSSRYLNEMTKYRFDVVIFCDGIEHHNYKPKNVLVHSSNYDLFTEPEQHIRFYENKSIVYNNIINPNLQKIYSQYANEVSTAQDKDQHTTNYNKLSALYYHLFKNNLFFDLYEYGSINRLLLYASKDHKELSNSFNIKNLDLFKLSNKLTNNSPIPFLDFLGKSTQKIKLGNNDLLNYYILKVPKQLMCLLSIN